MKINVSKRVLPFLTVLGVLLFLLISMPSFQQAASPFLEPALIISEVMANNERTLTDEDGDYADWLEIQNRSSRDVDLDGWYLTDSPEHLIQWQFPQVSIPAGGTLLVYASGKNRAEPGQALHTNFRLAGQGEYLALVKPDGRTVAWAYDPQYAPQDADTSYGVDGQLQKRHFALATPGMPNPVQAGPIISQPSHQPQQPEPGEPLTITARVQSVHGLASMTLSYRVMFDEAVAVPMLDDGHHGDGRARDGIHGAIIPGEHLQPGQLIRYAITATDKDGSQSRRPLFAHAETSPEYFGSVVASPTLTSSLPILHWFVADPNAALTLTGTRSSIVYAGTLYDNILVRVRGQSSLRRPEKNLKVDFNPGHLFQFRPGDPPVEELNLNASFSDKSHLREVLAWETYHNAGVPGSISFPVRVQQNGHFYTVAIYVEQPDERYLERNGLDPEGALYKMYQALDSAHNFVEKKTRLHENHDDLQALVDALILPEPERTRYLYDHVNLPAVLNYLATASLLHDTDLIQHNYYVYRDTQGSGEWMFLPWDKDLTFGRAYVDGTTINDVIQVDHPTQSHPLYGDADHPKVDGHTNALIDALYSSPTIQSMYLRRWRTLKDELLQPPETPEAELRFEKRIDALFSQMRPDMHLEREVWPITWGEQQTFTEAVTILKEDYLAMRRHHLYEVYGDDGGMIPPVQPATTTVQFGDYEAAPRSGNPDEAYFSLVNPNDYAVDVSGWAVAGDVQYTFRPGVVLPARGTLYVSPNVGAFRHRAASPTGGEGRFVQGNYRDDLAVHGARLALYNNLGNLVAIQAPDAATPPASRLVISEINYNPPGNGLIDGNRYEFIELQNLGQTAVDLNGFELSGGIYYRFIRPYVLKPNETVVLIQEQLEFMERYPGVSYADVYLHRLKNSGEMLTLRAPNGWILESFTYDDSLPWPELADGGGRTLVRRMPVGDPASPQSWRASLDALGSPGTLNPRPAVGWAGD